MKYRKNNFNDFNRITDDNKNDFFYNKTSRNFYSKKIEFNNPISGAHNKKENKKKKNFRKK